MTSFAFVLTGVALASLALGWPADSLARRPGVGGGLGWLGLTFVAPAALWIPIAIVRGSDYDTGGVAYFFGYAASVAAVFVGTMLVRTIKDARCRRGRAC